MKKFFLRLAVRERLLLLVFLGLAAGLWGWGASVRFLRWRTHQADYRRQVAEQQLWIERKPQIEALARQAALRFQPDRTLDAVRLFSEVNRLAAGMNFDVDGQRSEQSGRIAIHQVQLNLRLVDITAFLAFYAELQKREPYLGIEQCEFSSERAAAGRLNARIRIYAIEVLTEAPPLKI
jgi:hypothetical protein